MNTGTIIALVIVVLSLLMLVVLGLVTYSKIKPTLKNIKDTNEVVTQKINYFTHEGEHITEEVEYLNQRVTLIQQEVEEKNVHLQDLTNENGKFQTSLQYLKGHAGEYSSGISKNLKNEIQEDGPKLIETFKRAFRKTKNKQKVRYQK